MLHCTLAAVGIGVLSFISTNIDNFFLLLLFFSSNKMPPIDVATGYFIGIFVIILSSFVLGSLGALIFPKVWICLMGAVPIFFGLRKLRETATDQTEPSPSGSSGFPGRPSLSFASITLASGGDNIAVYIPLFSERGLLDSALLITVFLMMTCLWCSFAYLLVSQRKFSSKLRQYGQLVLPFVLIGLGISIMVKSAHS